MRRIYNYLKNLFLKVFGISSCAELEAPVVAGASSSSLPTIDDLYIRNQKEFAAFAASVQEERMRRAFKINVQESALYVDPGFVEASPNHIYQQALLYGMLTAEERKAENLNEFGSFGGGDSGGAGASDGYAPPSSFVAPESDAARRGTIEDSLRMDREDPSWQQVIDEGRAANAAFGAALDQWRASMGVQVPSARDEAPDSGGGLREAESGRDDSSGTLFGRPETGPIEAPDGVTSYTDNTGTYSSTVPGAGSDYSGSSSTTDAGYNYSSGSDTSSLDSWSSDGGSGGDF